jgi:hypothetical protein
MPGRSFTREFKLEIVRQLARGEKRPAQICREQGLAESVLAQVETTLRNQLGEGHYVTIFYAVLDLRTRVLHYVNAGHCPPILRRHDRRRTDSHQDRK